MYPFYQVIISLVTVALKHSHYLARLLEDLPYLGGIFNVFRAGTIEGLVNQDNNRSECGGQVLL